MKIDEVTIISGGLGTRLGKIGEQIPKVLIPLKSGTLLDRHLQFIQAFSASQTSLILAQKYKHLEKYFDQSYPELKIIWEEKSLGISHCLLEETLNTVQSKLIIFGDVFHQNIFHFEAEYPQGILLGINKHHWGNSQNECQIELDSNNQILKMEDKANTNFSEWCWNGTILINNLNSSHKNIIEKQRSTLIQLAAGNIFKQLQHSGIELYACKQEGDYINLNTEIDLKLLEEKS